MDEITIVAVLVTVILIALVLAVVRIYSMTVNISRQLDRTNDQLLETTEVLKEIYRKMNGK